MRTGGECQLPPSRSITICSNMEGVHLSCVVDHVVQRRPVSCVRCTCNHDSMGSRMLPYAVRPRQGVSMQHCSSSIAQMLLSHNDDICRRYFYVHLVLIEGGISACAGCGTGGSTR
jgi:hypothetical protein